MNVQVSLKVLPSIIGRKKVYEKVNEPIKLIANSNLRHIFGPSETTIQGDYDEIFELINKIHKKLVDDEVRQITMIIVTDYNKENQYIDEKLESVNNYFERK